jgi:pilus assembly protein CpaC
MKRPLAILLLVIMVLPPTARAGQLAARTADAVAVAPAEQVDLMVGRSAVLKMDRPITRVSLSTPDIADALVTTPYEVLVHGKTPGTISLLVWSDNGRIKTYDVAVRRDLSNLEAQIRKLFPGEAITVASNGKDVVLSGAVSTKYIVDRASSLALGYVEKAENVVNLMRQQAGPATNQILLRVRFAEVSRSAMQELGASFFTGPLGKENWIGRSTTQQYAAPDFEDGKLIFSDFLNLFLFNTEEQLGTVIRALKGRGLFQSLAEPVLITRDGQEATFLAGGEYPYPVVQGTGNTNAVTIVFKEFGVRLRFTPTVTADNRVQLKVAPEVSSLDFGNAVVLEGFRVPALSTRRTETSVELLDGQTFAIAGMIDNNMNETLRRVPGLGDVPILGYLFRSQAYQKNATELVVMITPHIVRQDSPGVTPNLPGLVEPFLGPTRRIPAPPAAFTGPMTQGGASQPTAQTAAANVPASAPAPVATATATPASPAASTIAAKPAAAAVTPSAAAVVKNPATSVSTPNSGALFNAGSVPSGASLAAQETARIAQLAMEQQKKAAQETATPSKKELEQAKKDEEKRRQEEKRLAELQRKQEVIAAREAHLQAQRDGERARAAARAEAERIERERKEQERTRKSEAERQEVARKEAEKVAAQQRIEAARIKEAADKLAREKQSRDAELEKLVQQYQKLLEGQQTPAR